MVQNVRGLNVQVQNVRRQNVLSKMSGAKRPGPKRPGPKRLSPESPGEKTLPGPSLHDLETSSMIVTFPEACLLLWGSFIVKI